MGLLGTVVGLIHTFGAVAAQGSRRPTASASSRTVSPRPCTTRRSVSSSPSRA
ncbi:MAG: MotA/TolQ/ExbB proton channel family protein [Polyangiaceae bacterium]